MTHIIAPANSDDLAFAHDLTHSNMAPYYSLVGRTWNQAIFESSWPETENFRLLESGIRVGILRLSEIDGGLHIRDMQVLRGFQNRGIGTAAIKFANDLAVNRGLPKVALRVFLQNPARSLYKRIGFLEVATEDDLVLLEKSVV